MMVAAKSDIKNIDDLKRPDRQIKISASGKGSSGHFDTAMLARIFGLNVKIIFGFEGTEGEIACFAARLMLFWSRSSLQHFVDTARDGSSLRLAGNRDRP